MRKSAILISSLILMSSCRSFFCPENTKYHFFTKEELSPILEQPDSILTFQEKLRLQNKTDGQYVKKDTFQWIDEKHDTIMYSNSIFFNTRLNQLCETDIPMRVGVGGTFLSDYAIKWVQILFDKTIVDSDPIVKTISFSTGVNDVSENIFDYNKSYTNILGQHFSSSTSLVNILNTSLENCLIFDLYEKDGSRIIQMVYSKKYGFVKITTKEHEITRIL